jgi:hypothetical protein
MADNKKHKYKPSNNIFTDKALNSFINIVFDFSFLFYQLREEKVSAGIAGRW